MSLGCKDIGTVPLQEIIDSLEDWKGFLREAVKVGDVKVLNSILEAKWPDKHLPRSTISKLVLEMDRVSLVDYVEQRKYEGIFPEEVKSKEMALALSQKGIKMYTLSIFLKYDLPIDDITIDKHGRDILNSFAYVKRKEEAKRLRSLVDGQCGYIHHNEDIEMIRYVVEELEYGKDLGGNYYSVAGIQYALEKGLRDKEIRTVQGTIPQETLDLMKERNVILQRGAEEKPLQEEIAEALKRNSYKIPETVGEYFDTVNYDDIHILTRAIENSYLDIPEEMVKYAFWLICTGMSMDDGLFEAFSDVSLPFAKKFYHIMKNSDTGSSPAVYNLLNKK